MKCEPVKDRSEIPYLPQLITFPARYCGKTQKEIYDSPQVWYDCLEKTWKDLGHPDAAYMMPLRSTIFSEAMEANRPGIELGDDEQFQFIEKPHMDVDGYRDVVKNGYMQFFMKYMCSIQHPPCGPEEVGKGFGMVAQDQAITIKFLLEHDVQPIFFTANMPPFDMFSMIRSFSEYVYDIYDEPELVKQAIEKAEPELTGMLLGQMKQSNGINRVGLFAMRSDSNAISPAIFEEFSWPTLKKMILTFQKAGIVSVIHADSNWLPILHFFRELPKGCCHFELDGKTDLLKAAEVLDGWQSFRGDVPATMLAFGTPDDVKQYCEKLITQIGLKTPGFMLGSGCEVPLNAKPENVKAMWESLGRKE
jgi:uroporphyrinogen decarboxylase